MSFVIKPAAMIGRVSNLNYVSLQLLRFILDAFAVFNRPFDLQKLP